LKNDRYKMRWLVLSIVGLCGIVGIVNFSYYQKTTEFAPDSVQDLEENIAIIHQDEQNMFEEVFTKYFC